MGRTGTWLVAVGVSVLAAIAAIDALVGSGGSDPGAATSAAAERQSEDVALAAEALRAQSVYGTLLYADLACAVHALPLADVARAGSDARAPTGEEACMFATSPGGSFSLGEAAPRPGSDLRAVCARGEVVVGTEDGSVVARAPGCAPAWKPDGDLTAVHGGELVDVAFTPRGVVARPPRVLVGRADIRRVFTGPPWGFAAPAVREAAWLDDERVALIVGDRVTGEDALAVFAGRRLVGGPPFPYEELARLRPSPRGTYVAARVEEPGGIVIVDRRGELVSFPFRGARAVAWSPDEVWTAAATRDSVYIFATGERPSRFARLPIAARDLAWP